MANPQAMQGFDWDYWLASAKSLEPGHPTIARVPASSVDLADPAGHLIDKLGEWACARWIRQFPNAFSDLSKVMRTRGLSIRTEKAYLHWLCRFVA